MRTLIRDKGSEYGLPRRDISPANFQNLSLRTIRTICLHNDLFNIIESTDYPTEYQANGTIRYLTKAAAAKTNGRKQLREHNCAYLNYFTSSVLIALDDGEN